MKHASRLDPRERVLRQSVLAFLGATACGVAIGAGGCVTRARGERSDLLQSPRLTERTPADEEATVIIGAETTTPAEADSSPISPGEGASQSVSKAQEMSEATGERPQAVSASPQSAAAPETAEGADAKKIQVEMGPPAMAADSGDRQVASGPAVARAPVDAMIGQINGVPLFASDILAPMDARLRAESEKMARDEFLIFAREQIRRALRDRLRDELLLAEARSSLTPEQKVGLRFFMQSLREDLVRGALGSEELAERRLQEEEEGLTLEEEVERRRDRELILLQLRKILRSKMQISWREVRQEYERQMAQQAERPVARFRLIWLDAEDEDAARRVQTALEEDVPFAEIAGLENVRDAEDAGLIERELDGPIYEESRLFGPDVLNEQAAALDPGGIVGPFRFLDYRVWMTLETIKHPSRSLYEAQIPIRDALRRQRMAEAEREYFQRLIDDSSLTDISDMERRLLKIARNRYLAPS